MALPGKGGWNYCLSPCRWLSWADDIPPVFTRKSKTSWFLFSLFSHHSCRKPGEKRHPSCSSSCARKPFLSPKCAGRSLLASSVRELNWKIFLQITLPLPKASAEALGTVPLCSHTCTGLVALLHPWGRLGGDMHIGTLPACLCAWLVSWVKV